MEADCQLFHVCVQVSEYEVRVVFSNSRCCNVKKDLIMPFTKYVLSNNLVVG